MRDASPGDRPQYRKHKAMVENEWISTLEAMRQTLTEREAIISTLMEHIQKQNEQIEYLKSILMTIQCIFV